MKLDPTKMKDWQIAEAAEATMKPVTVLACQMGLLDKELIPMGRQLAKVDFRAAMQRLRGQPQGKYLASSAKKRSPASGNPVAARLSTSKAPPQEAASPNAFRSPPYPSA